MAIVAEALVLTEVFLTDALGCMPTLHDIPAHGAVQPLWASLAWPVYTVRSILTVLLLPFVRFLAGSLSRVVLMRDKMQSNVFGTDRRLVVEYRDLVDKGADRTELQSFLTQGDMVTTTIRIPANLKKTISEEASLQGMSFSAFIRRCAIQSLSEDWKR